jgi:hypothetical protein
MGDLDEAVARDVLEPFRNRSLGPETFTAVAKAVAKFAGGLNDALNLAWVNTIHAVFPKFDAEGDWPSWDELHAAIADLHKRNRDLTDGAAHALEENDMLAEVVQHLRVSLRLLCGNHEIDAKQAAFDLWLTFHGDGKASHMTTQVYLLIAKADPEHRARIRLGFPTEVRLWEEWQASRPESAFFEKYEVKHGP